MKRTALKRKTPLERHSRVRAVNRARLAKRRAEAFGRQADLSRYMPCCACRPHSYAKREHILSRMSQGAELQRCGPDHAYSEPHHEPPRSRGGKDADTVPLCPACHRERHDVGLAEFQRRHGIDLRGLASRLAAEMEKQDGQRNDSST